MKDERERERERESEKEGKMIWTSVDEEIMTWRCLEKNFFFFFFLSASSFNYRYYRFN